MAANLLGGKHRRASDRIPAYALFTDPPLGRAGMEAEIRKSGRPALVARIAMEDVSRAYEKGETSGFMKLLVNAETKQILGATFLGSSGDEASIASSTSYAKAYTALECAVHFHPTVAEFTPMMLGDLGPLSA